MEESFETYRSYLFAIAFLGQGALGRAIATGWSRSASRFLFCWGLGGGSKRETVHSGSSSN